MHPSSYRGRELYAALRGRGVPDEMVIYPREPHRLLFAWLTPSSNRSLIRHVLR
jgi:dipeptidyl aminopeptidase/acylaminoacyl peptidase